MYNDFVQFVKKVYGNESFIPLHAPIFKGNEKKYLEHCIDTTYVSSTGEYVNEFEKKLAQYTGAKFAVVTSNGTSALHMALLVSGVQKNELVLTQSLSFIATTNAITYTGAQPVFIDVDKDTMGMSPEALEKFLVKNTIITNGVCTHVKTGKLISACVPMHTFGFPCRIDALSEICSKYNIPLIEDAAESLGSYYRGKHTGLFGKCGVMSFNGNKIITSGGGGAIITNHEALAKHAKHLTTQAKVSHPWAFIHDEIGYNYRMPNVNAALALAQLEKLNEHLTSKNEVAMMYKNYFESNKEMQWVEPIENAMPNYWLNTLLLKDARERDSFLKFTNENGVMTRPAWTLIHRLPMFSECLTDDLKNSSWLEDRIVNIPSSARMK